MDVFSGIRRVDARAVRMDGAWLFWAGEPGESLARSIRERGLMQPLLADFSSGEPVLVAGTRRLKALRELGLPAACLEVSAPEPEAGFLYLESNAGRELDDAMRLNALEYFAKFLDPAALKRDVCPLLGLEPRSGRAADLAAWLGFGPDWSTHLKAGRVPVAAAQDLVRLGEDGRAAVEPLFRTLSWSRGAAVNLLARIHEAGRMLGLAPAQVAERAGLARIAALDLSPKDAMAEMGDRVRRLRHPELTRLEDAFKSASEPVKRTGFACARVDNFETDRVRVQGVFKTPEALARAAEALAVAMRAPGAGELFACGEPNP